MRRRRRRGLARTRRRAAVGRGGPSQFVKARRANWEASQHLVGTTTTVGCTTNGQALALHAVAVGRRVAVSSAFRQRVGAATAGDTQALCFGSSTVVGPCQASAGDPFAREALAVQVERAAYASTDAADVTLRCGSLGGNVVAHANLGAWITDRQAPEEMTADQGGPTHRASGVSARRKATSARASASLTWKGARKGSSPPCVSA